MQVEMVDGSSLTYWVQNLLDIQPENTVVEGAEVLRSRVVCERRANPTFK